MNKNSVLFCLAGLIIGLVLGFTAANAISRRQAQSFTVAAANTPVASGGSSAGTSEEVLSSEEIQKAFERADADPENIRLQKNIGLALFGYTKMRGETKILPDIERLLKRTKEDDFEVLSALGELSFVLGQENGDSQRILNARNHYEKALKIRPEASSVRTDLASTYLFSNPPELDNAIAEYRKALKVDNRNERTKQLLATALLNLKRTDEASVQIGELEKINSSNPSLPDLKAQLAQQKLAK